jgi:hypothetical protein
VFGVDEHKVPPSAFVRGPRSATPKLGWPARPWGEIGARSIAVTVAESPSVNWYLRSLADADTHRGSYSTVTPQRACTHMHVRHRVRAPPAAAGQPGAARQPPGPRPALPPVLRGQGAESVSGPQRGISMLDVQNAPAAARCSRFPGSDDPYVARCGHRLMMVTVTTLRDNPPSRICVSCARWADR